MRLLSLPVISGGRPRVCSDDFEASAPSEALIGSLSTAIRSGMRVRVPNVEDAAALAGLTPRTLQRRLSEEGLDYRSLVNRVRYEEAVALLGEGEHSMADISRHLGYSSPANFTHAFRAWTGLSPSRYGSKVKR